jgi:hypothetical protein
MSSVWSAENNDKVWPEVLLQTVFRACESPTLTLRLRCFQFVLESTN